MLITDLLSPGRIRAEQDTSSKKRALELLSALLVEETPSFTSGEIFDSLITRERLGSTGLGKGVAIPHGRMPGMGAPIAAFLKLNTGIDFDAADGQPVDLLCALLVPADSSEEHLQLLAQLAQMFSDPAYCTRLRKADSDSELYELLHDWEPHRVRA